MSLMSGQTPLRELPGRRAAEAKQQFNWRFQTLSENFQNLREVQDPSPPVVRDHQYKRRGQIYEAERRLHNFLSGFYSFYSLVSTVANVCTENPHTSRIIGVRKQWDNLSSSKVVYGLRIYIQKENVLPLLIKQTNHSEEDPYFVLNKQELHVENKYRGNGLEHHYGHIEGSYIRPFKQIRNNWPAIEALREHVLYLLDKFMGEEIEEYKERLRELRELRDKHVPPELVSLLEPTDEF